MTPLFGRAGWDTYIVSELAARPELNKEETIRLMAFVVEREGGTSYLSSAFGLSHFPTGLLEASEFHLRQGLILSP